MGLLVDGKWHNDWYDTKSTKGSLFEVSHNLEIGSPQMVKLEQRAKAVLRLSEDDIIYMFH